MMKSPDIIGLKFTLVEMLVVIAIIGILASLLMPGLSGALESAHSLDCRNRLRQTGVALFNYSNDYKSIMPGNIVNGTLGTWASLLTGRYATNAPKYIEDEKVIRCPTHSWCSDDPAVNGKYTAFGIRGAVMDAAKTSDSIWGNYWVRLNALQRPGAYLHLADSAFLPTHSDARFAGKQSYCFVSNSLPSTGGIHLRHGRRAGGWFGDGHVEALDEGGLLKYGISAWLDADFTKEMF